MTRRLPRQLYKRSRRVATSMSVVCLAITTLICFCPVSARADSVKEYGTVIGIDLGTTYSRVSLKRGGHVGVIGNDQGDQMTPSWVSFTDNEQFVGHSAKNAFPTNPQNTVFDARRLLGQKMSDLQDGMKEWPFKVHEVNGKPAISVQYIGEQRDFIPEETVAAILREMKKTAERYLGETVTHAVVTIPSHFDDAQRHAMKEAGRIAGLTILRVINEPTAAVIAYGLTKEPGESINLVYDLGGGTFDVSVLSIDDGVVEILATAGDIHLGGQDFDNRVINHLIQLYKRRTGTDVTIDEGALDRLRREVERAKRTLSNQQTTKVEVESFENGKRLSEMLTRATFEELNGDLFNRTMTSVERVLTDANVSKADVDGIVLAGGSSHIPKIQQLLVDFFSGKVLRDISPDEVVAHGAAIHGSILVDSDNLHTCTCCIMDVCPLTLGIETAGGIFTKLIPRNNVIPVKKSQLFSTHTDNQSTVTIQIYEGERPFTKDNNLIGRFELTGIHPALHGTPEIKVAFEIDADGVLNVAAVDKGTGKSQSMSISHESHRLSPEAVENMVLQAQQYATEDNQRLGAFDSHSSHVYEETFGKLGDEEKGPSRTSTAVVRIHVKEPDPSIEGWDGGQIRGPGHDEL